MDMMHQYMNAVFKPDSDDPYVRPDADFYVAGIDVNSWSSRIEVYGEDAHKAAVLRSFVLDAVRLKQAMIDYMK